MSYLRIWAGIVLTSAPTSPPQTSVGCASAKKGPKKGNQRKGIWILMDIHDGYPLKFIDGYPSMNINGYPVLWNPVLWDPSSLKSSSLKSSSLKSSSLNKPWKNYEKTTKIMKNHEKQWKNNEKTMKNHEKPWKAKLKLPTTGAKIRGDEF